MQSKETAKLEQPRELYDIFTIELCERFAYYGMQILLVFFIADYLKLSVIQTIELNGAFIALVYASPTFGGFLADHYLGIKRTLVLGAVMLAFGYFFLGIIAIPEVKALFINHETYLTLFYWALGIIAIGNGCFKPSPTSLLAKVYRSGDPRIDAGYTIFYMSINIGSFCSILLTPIIHARFGYAPAFILCSVWLSGGLVYFSRKLSNFKEFGVEADFKQLNSMKICVSFLTIFALTIFAAYLLANLFYAKMLIIATVIAVTVMFAYFYVKMPRLEGNKLVALFILLFCTAVFFSMQLQMFGVLNIFIDKHVVRTFFGYEIPTGNFAVLNAFWVASLGPLMAKLYLYFEHKNDPLTMPSRFATGLLISATAFYLLSISSHFTDNGMISASWIVVSYLIISVGELLIGALGLAVVCKLAPPHLTSLFMGAFLLSLSVGGWMSGYIGQWVVIPEGVTNLQVMLEAYNVAFLKVGHMALGAGILASLLVPFLVRLTGEHHLKAKMS